MTGPAWVEGAGGGASTTLPSTNQTSTYAVNVSDCVINCTTGTFTVTLPTASGIQGQYFIVKNSGTGIITIDAAGSETIDGELTKILAVQYESITVISDGANWMII